MSAALLFKQALGWPIFHLKQSQTNPISTNNRCFAKGIKGCKDEINDTILSSLNPLSGHGMIHFNLNKLDMSKILSI